MKKVFTLFLGLILLPLAVHASEYQEGTNYEVIKQNATETPEVAEYFSFYCGHCYAFETIMSDLKSNLPEGVTFKKNHVDFFGREMGPLLTNAYAAAQSLQIEDKISALIFAQIQKQRSPINGEEGILKIFEEAGVPREEAENALQSFYVKGTASQMKRDTEVFNIRGVPTVIVNGKYKINRGSVKSEDDFIALVNYLTQKKD